MSRNRNDSWVEDVKIYAKARVEIKAKPGVPHDKTKDIEDIKAIITSESGLWCNKHEFCEFDDTEDKDAPTTVFIVDVDYYKPCEFIEVEGGEPDERLAEPIEDSLDFDYEGVDEFETDELTISITDIYDIDTEYES